MNYINIREEMCPVLLPGIATASTRRVVSSWSQVWPHIPLPSDTHSDKNRAYTPGLGGDKASPLYTMAEEIVK